MLFRQFDPYEKNEIGKYHYFKWELFLYSMIPFPSKWKNLLSVMKQMKVGEKHMLPYGTILKRTR